MDRSPPPYHEAIQMDGICPASAPLLRIESPCALSSLDEALYPLPETVNFSLSPDDPSTFYIRDMRTCVLIRGVISPGYVSLHNANGQKFLTIKTNRLAEDDNVPAARAKYVRKSEVIHGHVRLGAIVCDESNLNTIWATNLYDKYDFFLNCMGGGARDIVISKSRSSPPLCRVNVPECATGQGSTCFSATLVFSSDTPITKIEQCLCLSTVITFILTRNALQTVVDSDDRCKAYCLCFVICVVIGVLGWIFIAWLRAEECRRKPYRCRNN